MKKKIKDWFNDSWHDFWVEPEYYLVGWLSTALLVTITCALVYNFIFNILFK